MISRDGRCEACYELLDSAAQQKAASLKVEGAEVTVISSPAVGRALAAPFSIDGLIDSLIAAQKVLARLEAQGLKEAKTKIRSLSLPSDPNTLRNCGNTALPLGYPIGPAHPQSRVRLNPITGDVVFNTLTK